MMMNISATLKAYTCSNLSDGWWILAGIIADKVNDGLLSWMHGINYITSNNYVTTDKKATTKQLRSIVAFYFVDNYIELRLSSPGMFLPMLNPVTFLCSLTVTPLSSRTN